MDFYIGSVTRQQVRRILHFKGDVKSHTFDFNPWADDNGTVTTATWAVKSGQASVTSSALSSNVVTAVITTSEAGNSMLTLTVTDGTHTEVIYIQIRAKDPQIAQSEDYGMVVA